MTCTYIGPAAGRLYMPAVAKNIKHNARIIGECYAQKHDNIM